MVEGTKLAALVAAKICHDLVEPLAVLAQGTDFLSSKDAEVRDEALSMIDQGVRKAVAHVEFYRFAVGSALAEGEGELEEARAVAERLYEVYKPSLVWNAAAGVRLPRAATRVIAHLLFIAAKNCLPRGGTVEVTSAQPGEITISASGPRAQLKPGIAHALRGERLEGEFEGEIAQPLLTGILARQAGVELVARESEAGIQLIARASAIRLAA